MQNDIKNALEVLRKGGVILYPTDTHWSLGCDATNPAAVSKVLSIKKCTDSKSMIVLMDNENRLASYIDRIPDIAYDLFELSEKPLIIIFEDAKALAHNLINNDDNSIGIRITKELFSKQLIQQFKKPVVSTTTNIGAEPLPSKFAEISAEIINQVDYVVKYRQEDISKSIPSGIIKIGKDLTIKVLKE